jgi:hypothetical protein
MLHQLIANNPHYKSQDGAVGIAIGYGLDNRGIEVQVSVGSSVFISPYHSDQLWGPLASYLMGTRGLSLGVKQPWHEAHHSPPYSADVKKMSVYTSTSPNILMA